MERQDAVDAADMADAEAEEQVSGGGEALDTPDTDRSDSSELN